MSTRRHSPWNTNWDEVKAWEAERLRAMSPEEGAREYLLLREEFDPWLERDMAQFGSEYADHLYMVQTRWRKVKEWGGDPLENLLKAYVELQQRLEEAGIVSALIGGMAVGAWARARVTRDVDIKVLLHRDERQKLLDVLKTGYSFLHADPDAALRQNGVLFVLNSAGVRIDLQLADIEFDETLIARARTLELAPGYAVRVCTAEDLIILKVLAQRPQDDIDVERVIERQGQQLDEAYILNWLQRFERMVDDSTLVRRYQSIHTRALK